MIFNVTKLDRERADFFRVVEALQNAFGRGALPVHIPIGAEHDLRGVIDLVRQEARVFDRDGNGKGEQGRDPGRGRGCRRRVESEADRGGGGERREADGEVLRAGHALRRGSGGRAAPRRQPAQRDADHGDRPRSTASATRCCSTRSTTTCRRPRTARCSRPRTWAASRSRSSATPASRWPRWCSRRFNDPSSGRISLLRVASGTLASDSTLWNPRVEDTERAGSLLLTQGKSQHLDREAGLRRHRRGGQAQGLEHRRQPHRQGAAGAPRLVRADAAGDHLRARAQVQGRRGEDRRSDRPPARRGRRLGDPPRRADRRVPARGRGPAPRRDRGGEAQVALQGGPHPPPAQGPLPRDHQRHRRGPRAAQEADRRPRPVRRLQDHPRAAAARAEVRVQGRDLRRRHPAQLPARGREGDRRGAPRTATTPATRWSTSGCS